MGAITVALGLPSLLLLQPQRTRIPRLAHNLQIARHSHSSRILAATGNLRRGAVVCSASASWPYGSWATGEEVPSEQEQEEPVGRVEFLALGLGVAASVAVALFKQSGAGLILIALLTATTVALRKELAGVLSVPVAHLNSVQDALALHLSSIRNIVIYWGTGNGATVSSPATPIEAQEKDLKAEGLSSAEVEAALTEIAKSVAQLSMVITNLDNKVTGLEKDAASFRTLAQKNMESVTASIRTLSQKNMESVRTAPAVERRPKTTYTIRKPVASGSVTQLKWDEAVRRADQPKPQGYEPSKGANKVEAVENESKALPSTILYDSRGDRVLLLESRPVDVTFEVREKVSPSAPVELNFQGVTTGIAPQEDCQVRSKQENNASAEKMKFLFQDAPAVQPKQKVVVDVQAVKDAAQPLKSISATAPRRRGFYNREEARISRESSESEGYRAVPVTQGKPDTSRLKRIMNGEGNPNVNANAWVRNDARVSETREEPVLEVAATQSCVGWDEFPDSGDSWSDDRAGVGRGATQPQGLQNVLSYDGQDRSSPRGKSRPEGGEGAKSSSGADYSGRWPREGGSGATDADFGGNGSSSDTNEGENGSKRRQVTPRSAGSENDSDSESTTRDRRPSRATPSYPPERPETFRKFPDPNEDDEGFQRIIAEVEGLLKEGREGLEGRIEVGVAESMLYEAADLCEKAVEMRPGSLIAVGMWGNTLLLHGELKLRLSQNLRSMLPEPASRSLSRREYEEAEEERLSLESTLQDVGEECEQLLVEAGRKYRQALSMDRTDMRALYNWGLALCYRGQLIAEEGGETAAQDADKVFLAAIDKFEAMIGLSDTYAAGALLNWGLAMRDRSRLRPLESRERQKILSQAKEIFQEAVRLDPNYGQARGAVAACTVELKELQEYEQEPKKLKEPPSSSSRGFRDWWG